MIQIKGYHGTNSANVGSIQKENFKMSIGDAEWLGDGVYFFVDGIPPEPQIHAENWAIVNAWDKKLKINKYTEYAVLEVIISVNNDGFLDLTALEGIEVFNYLREKYISKIKDSGCKITHFPKDGYLINDARNNDIIKIDVVKGNFYIKFATERIYGVNFRTPNCTIISVFDPNENVVLSSIKKILEKKIPL